MTHLDLLNHLKPTLTGVFETIIQVAGTTVGYIIVTKLEAYSK